MESSVPFSVQLERIRPFLSEDQVRLLFRLKPGLKVLRLEDQCVLEVEDIQTKSSPISDGLSCDRITVTMRGCGCDCSDSVRFQRVRFEGRWQVTELDAPLLTPDGFIRVGPKESEFQWVSELVTLTPLR